MLNPLKKFEVTAKVSCRDDVIKYTLIALSMPNALNLAHEWINNNLYCDYINFLSVEEIKC